MPNILQFKELDSTNKYAKENFDSIEDRTLIVADSQTAGRGRRQKSWFSPPGTNLYASFVIKALKFDVSISSWIGGLAALKTVIELSEASHDFWIKWPNDVYCKDRKIAGVLCETVSDIQNTIKGVIIGIGINVNMTREQLEFIDRPATSLLSETNRILEVSAVSEILLKHAASFTDKAEQNPDELYNLWKSDNKILGRKINVDITGREQVTGKAIDIKRCGSLYLMDDKGDFHTLYSGDVSVKSFEK